MASIGPEIAALNAAVSKLEKDFDAGKAALKNLTEEYPDFADGHYAMATAWVSAGEDGKACKSFKRYLKLAPNGKYAANARANVAACE